MRCGSWQGSSAQYAFGQARTSTPEYPRAHRAHANVGSARSSAHVNLSGTRVRTSMRAAFSPCSRKFCNVPSTIEALFFMPETHGLPALRRRLPAADESGTVAAGEVDEASSVDDAHCFDCNQPHGNAEPPWASVSYGVTLCLNCAGVHRSFGVNVSFVRSLGLDTLTNRERRSLDLGGNRKFATFLANPERGVPRRIWLALPQQTRYFTPAADLYRRQLKAELDAADDAPQAGDAQAAAPSGLSMDTAIRPPPPSAALADSPPRWTANREAPRCELCRADFHLLKWRHHCRGCGRCVCDECSPSASWRPLPNFLGHEAPARHCKLCVAPTRLMPGM